jgi:transcriptional regulator with XRE-family HTH domain
MRGPQSSRPIQPVSAALVKLRRFLGETQVQFAKRMNVTPVSIHRWETSSPPTRDTLQKIYEIAVDEGYADAKIFRHGVSGEDVQAVLREALLERDLATAIIAGHKDMEALMEQVGDTALRDKLRQRFSEFTRNLLEHHARELRDARSRA